MIYPLPNEGKNKKPKTFKLNENVNTRAGMKLILNAMFPTSTSWENHL